MRDNEPDFNDVLDGAAHIIADGTCLRAGNPSTRTDDPDAENSIIVDAYPEPMMPDCHEVMRLAHGASDAQTLEAAIRERYVTVAVEWDE